MENPNFLKQKYNLHNAPEAESAVKRTEKGVIKKVPQNPSDRNDIVKEKLAEFPDGKSYEKKTEDMKHLTEIEKKIKEGKELAKDDLIFLYEIDSPIEYFGYQRDSHIKEIRKTRNIEQDMPIIFECSPKQIARRPEKINENTKAYVGKLERGIFNLIQQYNLEHIYTSFPEGKISIAEASLGGQSEEQIINELEAREQLAKNNKYKIYILDDAKSMLKNKEFYTLKNKEQVKLVKLKVRDLGFPDGATTKEMYKKAEEFGLELCPPETGPQIRLHYEEIFNREQPRGEYFDIGMKQINIYDGSTTIFDVGRNDDGKAWLAGEWFEPGDKWLPDYEFVFRLRPVKSAEATRGAGKLEF